MIKHPSPFSDEVIKQIQKNLSPARYPQVLDPFAGTGGIHKLKQRTVGVELEPEWAQQHPDTLIGDALHLPFTDNSFPAVATSPTFGNRMADHHNARDGSVRNTYRHRLGRHLSPGSSSGMQWGTEYRSFHIQAWWEVTRVVSPGGRFILHVKNHIRGGKEVQVAEWHMTTIMEMDWNLKRLRAIPARGLKYGANRDLRTDFEYLIVFDK